MSKPTILIACDVNGVDDYYFHMVGEKYVNAIGHAANAIPLLLPAWGAGHDMQALNMDPVDLVNRVDGVCLPGAVSNVHPSNYNAELEDPETRLDPQRDSTSLQIIRACIETSTPLLAICRGHQELNVALGGTLHQQVHQVPGLNDHREDNEKTRDGQYDPAHTVTLSKDGLLRQILNTQQINSQHIKRDQIEVNSLHHQGIDQLASPLQVDGLADDGLIEAISLPGQFVLGVQWHPEWHATTDPVSLAIFQAFSSACKSHR